jgi:hypothetical protein
MNPNHIKICKPLIKQGPKLSNLFLSLATWGCGPPMVPIYSTSDALGSSESGTGYATCGILVTAEARVPLRLGVPYRPIYVSYVFICIQHYNFTIQSVGRLDTQAQKMQCHKAQHIWNLDPTMWLSGLKPTETTEMRHMTDSIGSHDKPLSCPVVRGAPGHLGSAGCPRAVVLAPWYEACATPNRHSCRALKMAMSRRNLVSGKYKQQVRQVTELTTKSEHQQTNTPWTRHKQIKVIRWIEKMNKQISESIGLCNQESRQGKKESTK